MSLYVRFPVTCPTCAKESLTVQSIDGLVDALDTDAPVRLYSRCHCVTWVATRLEIEQIRQYLAVSIKFTRRNAPYMPDLVR